MSSQEERDKHRKRLKRKVKEKMENSQIKDLKKGRIVKDKRGNKYDLETMTHLDLIQAIQEKD